MLFHPCSPDKADKEAAFAAFTSEIEANLEEVAVVEAQEAEQEAETRREREEYEQR